MRVIDPDRWVRSLLEILARHPDDLWGERDAVHEFGWLYRRLTRRSKE